MFFKILAKNVLETEGRVFEWQAVECFGQVFGDEVFFVPILVGGDDVPGALLATFFEELFVGFLVEEIFFGFGPVAVVMFPEFFAVGDPFLEAFELAFAGDVEVEFEDFGAVGGQQAFEGVDEFASLAEEGFVGPEFDLWDQNVFVV